MTFDDWFNTKCHEGNLHYTNREICLMVWNATAAECALIVDVTRVFILFDGNRTQTDFAGNAVREFAEKAAENIEKLKADG